jgi:hypothetical protein
VIRTIMLEKQKAGDETGLCLDPGTQGQA